MTNSTRKRFFILGIALIGLGCAVLAALLSPFLGFVTLVGISAFGAQPIAAPDTFPKADIIYVGGKGLGFINADGSEQESFRFRAHGRSALDESMEMFLMTGDYETLVAVSILFDAYEGDVYVASPGETAVDCGWDGIIQLTPDQKHILVGTEHGHEEYLLTDCGTGNDPERTIGASQGILSPDEQYSVESRHSWSEDADNKFDLIIHNVETRDERVIEHGRFPAWSHDSQWLAYTGVDGIYVIQNNPNTKPRRVVSIEPLSESFQIYDSGRYPPVASWSPDGQWLVYHVSDDGYDYPYSIFRVNVDTGEVIKLLEGGMFPYWIWPAEKP